MGLFEEIYRLHQWGLYEDVKHVVTMLLAKSVQTSKQLFSVQQMYQLYIVYADAFAWSHDLKKAEKYYKEALGCHRSMKRDITDKTNTVEVTSEPDLRYKLYKVYWEMKQYKAATSVLEAVQSKDRTVAINMALAKLYELKGMDRSAITCYKEVLRNCPLALEASRALLSLGAKIFQITSLMTSALPSLQDEEWVMEWVHLQAELAERHYSKAISSLTRMNDQSLKHNGDLLSCLGDAYFLSGQYTEAKLTWQQALGEDPYMLRRTEKLACIYLEDKDLVELERLSVRLMGLNPSAPEPWLVSAAYCLASNKAMRAVYLAQKALSLQPKCPFAYIFKGRALLSMNNLLEAVQHFREAIRQDPYTIECYKALIDAYLVNNRVREAISMASVACKQCGTNATTLYMYGKCLAKDPVNIDKAKSYLEKSIKMDPKNLHPVYALAEIHLQQEKFDAGTELLRSCLLDNSTSKLHRLLGDFLLMSGDRQEALNQFDIALHMDSDNKKAKEGMDRAEKKLELSLDGYVMEEMDNSSEVDVNEHNLGSLAWSDTEIG